MDAGADVVAVLRGVTHRYAKTVAVEGVDLDVPAGRTVGVIGPDGVGKSTLLGVLVGARAVQAGEVRVLGGDMRRGAYRNAVSPRIAFMPQGLGRNLYDTLSVFENVDFFGGLFGQGRAEREARIAELLDSTGLAPFRDRPAGKLSGGMKQKLGLCCALIHDPDLLVLDEPTTGVDPLSRRQFWELIERIRARRPGMSVVVATAYMEEAERFQWLVAMDGGRILATGTPSELKSRTGTGDLNAAFIALLPPARRADHQAVKVPPRAAGEDGPPAIEARGLTMRFGEFTAVDHVDFRIERGEIFGFLGSNGCGKTTTMKMLTGLLAPSEGEARLFGEPLDANDLATRTRVGYMTQSFSLYGELTLGQNLELHARLFHLPRARRAGRIASLVESFDLGAHLDAPAGELPLGIRQRLSLAVAVLHEPEVLILDEPTSGVDPVGRDRFWSLLVDLSRNQGVTLFISTHFMNEAQLCDRISLMHAGKVLVSDTPSAIRSSKGADTLEQAFIEHLVDAGARQPVSGGSERSLAAGALAIDASRVASTAAGAFSWRRLLAYARRESLEIRRDPVRLAFALVGSVLLMLILGYGISFDVEDLSFAALDLDQTPASRSYLQNVAGSRYFSERAPIRDHQELDRRMRSGELSVAFEIPPGFGRALKRARMPQVGAWIDGAMPFRGETLRGYVAGVHEHYLAELSSRSPDPLLAAAPGSVEVRYRYNQDFRSLDAMVPATIPLVLILIPAMLMALGVVREKELGSIVNLYVTPVTRLEFLLGKQLPYIGIGMIGFLGLVAVAVLIFDVPVKGSLLALSASALLYVTVTTGLGLVMSSFTGTQIAAIFGTAIATMLPTVQFSGLTDPVSALEGAAAVIGKLFPATYFMVISRGIFTKDLGFAELGAPMLALAAFIPVLTVASVLLLRKQGR